MRIFFRPMPWASNQCNSAARIVPSDNHTANALQLSPAAASVSFHEQFPNAHVFPGRDGLDVRDFSNNLELHKALSRSSSWGSMIH